MVPSALLTAVVFGLIGVLYKFVLTDPPVCVVGAGPAGLATAAGLEQKGRNVVIFEKQAAVGGKCQAVYENDTFVPLGAFIFSNVTYRESLKLINETGVYPVPYNSGLHFDYDLDTGAVSPFHAPPPAFSQLLMQEFEQYSKRYHTTYVGYNMSLGYSSGIPEERTISTAQWLSINGYRALPALFKGAMVAYGYGDYREVPVVYMLQYLAPDVAAVLLRISLGQEIKIIDFHKVLVRFAKQSIKSPIHLSTSISEIDRTGSRPVITYLTKGSTTPSTQKCSAVVLAFHPTVSSLLAANMKPTPEEFTVFDLVGITNYWTGALRTRIPNAMTLIPTSASPMLPPAAVSKPIVVTKLQHNSNISTVGSWSAYRTNHTSTADAYNLLKKTLSTLNKDPRDHNQESHPLTDDDVSDFQKSEYFPHFDTQELHNGIYAKFQDLQGHKNTYYASGLNIFELVEYSLRAGQKLVDTFLELRSEDNSEARSET